MVYMYEQESLLMELFPTLHYGHAIQFSRHPIAAIVLHLFSPLLRSALLSRSRGIKLPLLSSILSQLPIPYRPRLNHRSCSSLALLAASALRSACASAWLCA